MTKIKATYIQHMGNELTPVNAARISFNSESEEFEERDRKLTRYLAKHKHLSPFEHCSLTVLIECPLFIRSQIHRHRTFSYNEVSRRYSAEELEFYVPTNFRKQHSTSKQCSDGNVGVTDNIRANVITQAAHAQSLKNYNDLLDLGVSREMARGVLPQNLMTKFWMTGNLRNWVHFLGLRLDEHAQQEVRELAEEIKDIINDKFPEVGEILLEETLK